MRHSEIGTDSKTLHWQRHFLSDVCPADAALLTEEPVPDHSSAPLQNVFTRKKDESITWDWSDWARAHTTVLGDSHKVNSADIQRPPENAAIAFAGLGPGTHLEILLEKDNGNSCAIKLELPISLRANNVSIVLKPRQRGGRAVVVSLPENTGFDQVTVSKFILGNPIFGDGEYAFDSKKRVIEFPVNPPVDMAYDQFLLAVSVMTQRGRKVLRCAGLDITGRLTFESGIPPERLDAICKKVETVPRQPANHKAADFYEWLDNWSSFSRERLLALRAHGMAMTPLDEKVIEELIFKHPSGFARCLLLQSLGCEWIREDLTRIIRSLNGDDFWKSLVRVVPHLGTAYKDAPADPVELLWALRNAANPLLAEAVEKTPAAEYKVRKRELHLLEMRRDARLARNSYREV